jgi:hypothetical protein
MADLPPYPGTPRWVKVFGIIALVVVLLFIILMLLRGPGGHGPRRHTLGENHEQEIETLTVVATIRPSEAH